MARRERATPGIRCANASLTGLKAGRVRPPTRADRHGRTARTVARARTSRRLAQEPATETGRSAVFATRAAMVDRSANASLNGPRAGRAPKPARADRRDPTPGMVGRANVGSTAQMQSVMATAEMPHGERATAPIRRANASLTGLRAGRALKPAKADLNDRGTRTAARAPTSSHPAQEAVTETGRGAPAAAREAKADRRAAAPRRSGGLAHRGRDRRKAAAARAGRHENRDPC